MKKAIVVVMLVISWVAANYAVLRMADTPAVNLDAVREGIAVTSAPKAELLIDTTTDTLVSIGDCDVEKYVAMADDMKWLIESGRSEEYLNAVSATMTAEEYSEWLTRHEGSDVLFYVDGCPIRHIVKAVHDNHGGYTVVETLR